MPRPSLSERYFAQCQAHRTPPLPIFVAGIRDGVMEVNLADVSLADIRLFALAVTDTTTTTATAQPAAAGARGRGRGRGGSRSASQQSDGASLASSAHGAASSFFTKLHFSYDPSSVRRQHAAAGGGGGGGVPSPPPLLAPQSEATLRCLIEAVAQVVKESAATLKSFAWCGLPVVPPSRGPLSTRVSATALTQLLPLCRSLTSLRIDGVALSRAQFMQLAMTSPASGAINEGDGGSWPALEEASFVNCDLTDACKGGIVRLIRAALPMKSAELWRRSLRSSNGSGDEHQLFSPPPTSVSAGTANMTGLRRLDLSENPLGDEAARAIATAISGSALHTLSLANTAVTSKGAALLLLPAVLEENAVELIDLSCTEVSDAYGTSKATAAAEMRLLAPSTIAAGFRVVARGMGQLLVLREAMRTAQQSWSLRTLTSPTGPAQAATATSSTVSQSPLTLAQLFAQHTRASRQATPVDKQRPGSARSTAPTPAEGDPYDAFIASHPAGQREPPQLSSPTAPAHPPPVHAAAVVDAPPQLPRALLRRSSLGADGTEGPAPASAAPPPPHASPQPPPPPLLPAQLPPAAGGASPYAVPWWSLLAAQWHGGQQSGHTAASPSAMPGLGEGYVPVPVPVPVPIFTAVPMQFPGAGAVGTAAWPPVSSGVGGVTAPPPPPTAAPLAAQQLGQAGGLDRAASDQFSALDRSAVPPPATVEASLTSPREEGAAPPAAEVPAEAAPAAHHELAAPSTVMSVTDAASSTAAIHEAAAAAGDSKFLLSLIARLEAHETDVAERLEQQFQRTTGQLTAMEKDMRFRLQQLAEAERKERGAAAERHEAVLQAITTLREGPAKDAAAAATAAMSEEMLAQLVKLIESGMARVQAAMDQVGGEKSRGEAASMPTRAAAVAGPAAVDTGRDMVKEASQRLKQLGW